MALKGSAAQSFVERSRIGIEVVTLDEQITLFNIICPGYMSRAIGNYNHWTSGCEGKFEWGYLSQYIRDILVYFVYQWLRVDFIL
jgi:hypothetical protein